MANIQVKRGLRANIPASAAAGEPVYTTDDQQLSFGTGAAVVPLKVAAANVVGLVNGGTEAINAQTGTSYPVVAGDAGKLVTLSNASAVAVSIAAATFITSQFVDFQNKGVGDVTITPASATINGAANLVLHTGQGVRVVFDGTNFQIEAGRGPVAKSSTTSQWFNSVGADGVFTSSQPAFTDITGSITGAQLPATIDGGTF